jgi:hypothetical protein
LSANALHSMTSGRTTGSNLSKIDFVVILDSGE